MTSICGDLIFGEMVSVAGFASEHSLDRIRVTEGYC
jgi:hypothetical protein